MRKAISRFDPVRSRTFEAAERHYVEVHHRFARNMHRTADLILQYVPNRALRQYDINGEFEAEPEAWRYVVQVRTEERADARAFLPDWARQTIWEDHANCLRNIRSVEVDPEIIRDECRGQMVFVKYLFEFRASGAVTAENGERHYAANHLPLLRTLLDHAFGFRKLITNRVLRQAVTAPLKEEGQVLTGEYKAPSDVYRIEEYWFDNAAWGGDFFRSDQVQRLLRAPQLGRMEGYLVEERCGVDKM